VNESYDGSARVGVNEALPSWNILSPTREYTPPDQESRCMAKATFYRVHVTPTQPGSKSPSRTVGWCFSPALAMESLSS
jgi:hypothetical protein